MHLLFLDDSHRRKDNLLGIGGYSIALDQAKALAKGLLGVKRKHGVPPDVEIKWSPPKNHWLKSHFAGKRAELYTDVLSLLGKHNATVFSVVHVLDECYGPVKHGWKKTRTLAWAARQQLKFVAERFHRPYLTRLDSAGFIVMDQFHSRTEEEEIIKTVSITLQFGSRFEKFERICLNPLTASSVNSPQIQVADVVAGVVVGALAGSAYAVDQFSELIPRFLFNPPSTSVGTFSKAVSGYGLKVFPTSETSVGLNLLSRFDDEWWVSPDKIYEAPF